MDWTLSALVAWVTLASLPLFTVCTETLIASRSGDWASYCNATYCVAWQVIDGNIILNVSNSATGYVAIGFSEILGHMGPADVYVAWLDPSGQPHVLDASTNATHHLTADAVQNTVPLGGSLVNGTLAVWFQRPLLSTDPEDKPILNQTLNVIWAYSNMMPLINGSTTKVVKHTGTQSAEINFVEAFLPNNKGHGTSDSPSPPPSSSPSPSSSPLPALSPPPSSPAPKKPKDRIQWMPVVALLAFATVVLVLGAFRRLGGRWCWWVDYRPLPACPPHWFHTLTLDVLPALCDLTVAELFVCALWLVADLLMLLSPRGNALGRACAFALVTVLLPVAKNSIWTHAVGCSFERAIKFHRWAARALVVLLVGHAVDQVLLRGSKVLATTPNDVGFGYVFGVSGFVTILAIVLLTVAPVRRRWHELFHYHHVLGLGAVALAMVHSIAVCYVVVPPLVLYFLDKAIIFALLSRPHRATATAVSGGTRLTIEDSVNVRYLPGQFFLVMVPGISRLETHPFTATGAPGQGSLTFLAKDMGPGSFTNRLAQLPHKSAVPVHLHGPYGSLTVSVTDSRVVFLIAGGAGVTPMASLAADLLIRRPEQLQVVFVWISRSADVFFDWCPTLLHDMLANPAFTVHLHCTAARCPLAMAPTFVGVGSEMQVGSKAPVTELDTEAPPLPAGGQRLALAVSPGRPDWATLFQPHASLGPDAAVLVCGPAAMVSAVQAAARSQGHRFSKETFEW